MNYEMWFDEKAEIVRVRIKGKFGSEDNNAFISQLEGLFTVNEDRIAIIDVSDGNLSIPKREEREKMVGRVKKMDFERIAFVGASPLVKMMMKIVAISLGKKGCIGSFQTDDEALIWIQSQRKIPKNIGGK